MTLRGILEPPPEKRLRFHADDLFASSVRGFLWGAWLGFVVGGLVMAYALDAFGRLR